MVSKKMVSRRLGGVIKGTYWTKNYIPVSQIQGVAQPAHNKKIAFQVSRTSVRDMQSCSRVEIYSV